MTIHPTPLGRALKPVLWGLFFSIAAGTGPVFATGVDTEGVFELDGNAVDDPLVLGIDWDKVYPTPGVGQTFITDPVHSSSDDTFIGGGSKDERDISSAGITKTFWQNTLTTPPDKDDLEHAYATMSTAASGDQLIYFGADRLSNNGDSAIGFWFFKQAVKVNPDGTFTGTHTEGDILVTSDFRQGGGASVINVFEWNGNASNPLTLLEHSELRNPTPGLFCTSDHYACAMANPSAVSAPWSYTFKGTADPNTFPAGTFFEGGIDLTELLGGFQCYSSFMAMTRTSASTTAQLKDFVIGPFANCSIGVSKTCTVQRLTTAEDGTDKYYVTGYEGTVTNTSDTALPAGTVITVRDDVGTADPATSDDQTQTFTLASDLPKNGTQSFSGTFFTDDNPPHNTVYATAKWGDNTLSADYDVDCSGMQLNPDLSLTKSCGSSDGTKPATELVAHDGVLALKVNASGTVCNTSATTGLNLDVTITDDAVGLTSDDPPDSPVVFSGTLVQGDVGTPGRCATFDYSYLPASGDGSTSPASDAIFSDTVTALGTNPALTEEEYPTTTATAHCSVCICLPPSVRSH